MRTAVIRLASLPPVAIRLASSSASQAALDASLGIRQSPRGERLTEPTLGPSGAHRALVLLVEEARHEHAQPARAGRRRRSGPRRRGRPGTASCAGPRPAAAGRRGRSRAARRARRRPPSAGRWRPSASGRQQLRGDRRVQHALQHRALGLGRLGGPATQPTSWRTSVLGTPAFTWYIEIWSPPKVHQPSASSREVAGADAGARPPCWRGPSGPACARAPAAFSKATLAVSSGAEPDVLDVLRAGGADVDLAQRARRRRGPARARCRSVRSVVPKPGMVTARIPSRGSASRSNVRSTTSRASVESSPPERPRVTACTPGVLEALGQARGLDGEDLLGSARRAGRGRRARTDADPPAAPGGAAPAAGSGASAHAPVRLGAASCTPSAKEVWRMRSTARRSVSTSVTIRSPVAPEALALREQRRVLRHQELAAEHDVGGGLVHAVVRVDVGGRASRPDCTFTSSRRYSALATSSLEADRFSEHGRARHRVEAAGRDGGPQVLADLDRRGSTRGLALHARRGGRCRRALPAPARRTSSRSAPRARTRTSAPRSTPCSRAGRSWAPRRAAGPPWTRPRTLKSRPSVAHGQADGDDHGGGRPSPARSRAERALRARRPAW